MSGRDARGERWRFDVFDHELKVTRSGRLDYLERYRLTPALRAVGQPWVASGAAYFGTVLGAADAIAAEPRTLCSTN